MGICFTAYVELFNGKEWRCISQWSLGKQFDFVADVGDMLGGVPRTPDAQWPDDVSFYVKYDDDDTRIWRR